MGTVTRVGIVGQGHVGAHVANSLILQGIADELVLCDINGSKLAAEVQDLNDSLAFCPHNVAIESAADQYEALADCDVIVNAAGDVSASAQDRDGELFVTTAITQSFPQRIVAAGFSGVWVTIANPCDVIATQIWHLTDYDPRKIIGSGTALDSSRMRHVLSKATGYDQHSIGAYMLGEHGFSQFTAWSNVNFGGKPLAELEAEQPERFTFDKDALEEKARKGGYVAMAGKHCTEYAVANAAARLVRAVVSNEHFITACGTLMTGQYGEEGLWASLPCVVGANGVEEVIELDLTAEEVEKFHASCAHIRSNIERAGV
ncbi:L-lactate dehydrogenase [Olsenella sp. YH-ols2217]|uniref:L-lactate dehydrogenase n=1 Tax=Kribbibacterium absianum TaxID=3044210 RepID=A0ABT6ZKE2_9ACTN|nr:MULTISPECIES: L-lactate dehydrogenase [unclassified Olsenella]MDJ1122467.1 L-lactate dehydrogenase [Olsenella sp. YH-ols2216]MDJ1129279.1 L-lactate dehydrogenase [Olsenella sp. YH-ols2217]